MGYKTFECPVSKQCGGCEWLNVPYPIQLKRKQQYVAELFEGIVDARNISPIIGMDQPIHCRNKIIVPYAPGKGGKILYGMYAKGTHRIVSRQDCLVEDEQATPILATIAKLAKSFKLAPYDEDTGRGFLRYTLLRTARATGQVLVCLVCAGDQFRSSKAFCRELVKQHPQISTVVMNVNKRNTNVVLGQQEHVLYGKGWIEDVLLGCRFRISATSFFQVNPQQTEKLYQTAIDYAELDGRQTILDAYCGTGTIGIIASKKAKRLIGVESNGAAVRDARTNARKNEVENAEFVTDDASSFMMAQSKERAKIDVVFMDPPRSGSDERFLKALAALHPRHVVYISCNPKTQVRDCSFLLQHGYRISQLQPVDMFPHTQHVECVVLMARGG